MEALSIIYWTRVVLGILAALISVALNIQDIYTAIAVAILVYLLTNYIIRWQYKQKVQSPSKIITTGIGAYFLTWVVMWVFFYTLLRV
jgi:predicted PurR-regulated permease PerM